jgi:NADPH:quinone reductase-like Zn-dependent oxidoreductase
LNDSAETPHHRQGHKWTAEITLPVKHIIKHFKLKAFTKTKYGGPEVLQLEDVEKPSLKEGHILVKVVANSANPADWHILRGEPVLARFAFGLLKPKNKLLGADFAGIVEETGNNVKHFKVGDRVFGESYKAGAFAEYICVPKMFVASCRREPISPKWQVFPLPD